MEENTYVKIISKHYMCSIDLAKKIIKSAELNNTKRELDRIVQDKISKE